MERRSPKEWERITPLPALSKTLNYATFSQRCCVTRKKKEVLKLAKGNFGSRGNVWTVAKNTVEKGLQFAYTHRREKKRNYRSLWIVRINAAVRIYGMTYSEFIGKMNQKGIALNRKVLADLALNEPKAFEAIVNAVK